MKFLSKTGRRIGAGALALLLPILPSCAARGRADSDASAPASGAAATQTAPHVPPPSAGEIRRLAARALDADPTPDEAAESCREIQHLSAQISGAIEQGTLDAATRAAAASEFVRLVLSKADFSVRSAATAFLGSLAEVEDLAEIRKAARAGPAATRALAVDVLARVFDRTGDIALTTTFSEILAQDFGALTPEAGDTSNAGAADVFGPAIWALSRLGDPAAAEAVVRFWEAGEDGPRHPECRNLVAHMKPALAERLEALLKRQMEAIEALVAAGAERADCDTPNARAALVLTAAGRPAWLAPVREEYWRRFNAVPPAREGGLDSEEDGHGTAVDRWRHARVEAAEMLLLMRDERIGDLLVSSLKGSGPLGVEEADEVFT